MSSDTKIVVLKSKELIYTIIFIVLAILLILLFFYMFSPGKNKDNDNASTTYKPGVYTSTLCMGANTLNVKVTVDKDNINNVSIENLDETITTMYPLLEPSIEEINNQLPNIDSLDELQYSSDNQYTYIMITQAINDAIKNASTSSDEEANDISNSETTEINKDNTQN